MTQLFLYLVLMLLPLGNILRLQVGGGTSLLALDVAVGLVCLSALPLYRTHRKQLVHNTLFRVLMLFYAVAGVSLLVNSVQLSMQEFLISSLYLLRFIAYSQILWIVSWLSKTQKASLVRMLFLVGLAAVTAGLLQFVLYPDLRNLYYLGWDEHLYRLFGTFFDPNFAGAFFGLLLGVHVYLYQEYPKRRRLVAASALLTLSAIFLTYSRSSYLMLAGGTLVYAVLKRRVAIILAFMLIFLLALAVLPRNSGGEGVKLLRTASIEARLLEYREAGRIISENPFLGVGFNAYRYAQLDRGFIDAEKWQEDNAGAGVPNSYLFVTATTGIVGLMMYLTFWVFVLIRLVRKKNYAFTAVLAGLAVHALFENSLFYPYIMLPLFMLSGTVVGDGD